MIISSFSWTLEFRSSIFELNVSFSSSDIVDWLASALIAAVSVSICASFNPKASSRILIASSSDFHCDSATAFSGSVFTLSAGASSATGATGAAAGASSAGVITPFFGTGVSFDGIVVASGASVDNKSSASPSWGTGIAHHATVISSGDIPKVSNESVASKFTFFNIFSFKIKIFYEIISYINNLSFFARAFTTQIFLRFFHLSFLARFQEKYFLYYQQQ